MVVSVSAHTRWWEVVSVLVGFYFFFSVPVGVKVVSVPVGREVFSILVGVLVVSVLVGREVFSLLVVVFIVSVPDGREVFSLLVGVLVVSVLVCAWGEIIILQLWIPAFVSSL